MGSCLQLESMRLSLRERSSNVRKSFFCAVACMIGILSFNLCGCKGTTKIRNMQEFGAKRCKIQQKADYGGLENFNFTVIPLCQRSCLRLRSQPSIGLKCGLRHYISSCVMVRVFLASPWLYVMLMLCLCYVLILTNTAKSKLSLRFAVAQQQKKRQLRL